MQSKEVIENIVHNIGFPSAAEWHEAITQEKFFRQLELIRQQELAVVLRENSRLTSVAVPVKDAAGKNVLCVSTVYITGRHQLDDQAIVAKLREIADELHQQICFHHISVQDINNL